jgi:hypothetical protein
MICLGEDADLFHPTECACAYYAHAQCHTRTSTFARIGCVYCRWPATTVARGVDGRRGSDDDRGFDDHDLQYIISFEDSYFVFVGRLVGVTILWSMAFVAVLTVGYTAVRWS